MYTWSEILHHWEGGPSGLPYLPDLHSVAFIDPKGLNGKLFSFSIGGLPNVKKSPGCNGV